MKLTIISEDQFPEERTILFSIQAPRYKLSFSKMYKDLELRKLPSGSLYSLIDILETNQDWKKVMSYIPRDPLCDVFERKYNNEHVRLIEENAKVTGKKCSEILFEEWGTSGRVRPTLNILKKVVLQAQIYRAADEIALMIEEELPERPAEGPAAAIDTGLTELLDNMDSCLTNHNEKVTKQMRDADYTIGNKTTVEMKSASDLIKFSSGMTTAVFPDLSALQSLSTAQLKSHSDSQFPKRPLQDISDFETTLPSSELPHFSAIMNHPGSTSTLSYESMSTASHSSRESSHITSSASANQHTPPTQAISKKDQYQTSLPNIDMDELSLNNGIDSSILQDENLVHFEYETLSVITNNFSKTVTANQNGPIGQIGAGGFGEVFVGYHGKYGLLAIKKAHNFLAMTHTPDLALKVFNAEVRNLSQFSHKNIVPILGFSINGPALCIVCEYIDGGSLEEKIEAKVLSEWQRIKIMVGTADGLKYLHRNENDFFKTSESTESQNLRKNNFVHGDVKSANILLTKDCVPKLCDFGLARQFDTTLMITSPMGTSAYMAPEGFSGTITQKIDIYSFGIVLLELLTGLRPIIVNFSERINIKDYVEEKIATKDISSVLDQSVVDWKTASEVYALAVKCLERNRKSRPAIEVVCELLDGISKSFNNVTYL